MQHTGVLYIAILVAVWAVAVLRRAHTTACTAMQQKKICSSGVRIVFGVRTGGHRPAGWAPWIPW